MRHALFYTIVRRWVPEGCLLPGWAIALRWALFPVDSAFWRMHRLRGYQVHNDTWLIYGATYTNEALLALARAQGETFRVTRTDGGAVMLERVHNTQVQP